MSLIVNPVPSLDERIAELTRAEIDHFGELPAKILARRAEDYRRGVVAAEERLAELRSKATALAALLMKRMDEEGLESVQVEGVDLVPTPSRSALLRFHDHGTPAQTYLGP
jgi:hypothetical protein